MASSPRPICLNPETVERFWRKVEKTDSCWQWTGALGSHGYGNVNCGGITLKPHRIAYELLVAPIPDGLTIDHLCRNRACVNPAHLEAVTMAENLRRGSGVGGQNYRKTHCKRGHEFTPENTILRKSGGRECRACSRVLWRGYARKRRAAARD